MKDDLPSPGQDVKWREASGRSAGPEWYNTAVHLSRTPASSLDSTVVFAMIDKADFYHGAALVRVIEDTRCKSIAKRAPGYLINGRSAVCVKYTTKTHSPWRFTLTADDIRYCASAAAELPQCIVAFVCGGDGVCALSWDQLSDLVGPAPAWVAAKRAFNGCYSVSAANGTLERKVARRQWPGILFSED